MTIKAPTGQKGASPTGGRAQPGKNPAKGVRGVTVTGNVSPIGKKPPVKGTRGVSVPGNVGPIGKEPATVNGGWRDKRLILKAAFVAALLLVVFLWRGGCSRSTVSSLPEENTGGAQNALPESGATSALPQPERKMAPNEPRAIPKTDAAPVVSSVRITPSQPLASDQIRAEAVVAGGDSDGVTFSYRWKLNDRFVPGAEGSIMRDVPLHRRDRVSVVVSATRDGREGPRTESQTVVVYSLPPSLEMKVITDRFREGDTAGIQLVGTAPDGDKVVFALTAPFVEGMVLEQNTGKILWKPKRLLQGKIRFGASVADTDGNRTLKVFELDLGAGGSS